LAFPGFTVFLFVLQYTTTYRKERKTKKDGENGNHFAREAEKAWRWSETGEDATAFLAVGRRGFEGEGEVQPEK